MQRKTVTFVLICTLMSITIASLAKAQSSQSYLMSQGGEITLPSGDGSFVDRAVIFDEGKPHSKIETSRDAQAIVGPPDRSIRGVGSTLTLGCHGEIIAEFLDNALIDVEGPDLHVWEVGDDVEPMDVAISKDGMSWIELGMIAGGTTSVDISTIAEAGASYRFVRLTDKKCLGRFNRWPGADIDAIAAIGSAQRFIFDSGVLFDYDEAILSPEAMDVLQEFAKEISQANVLGLLIEGHTDSQGSAQYNIELSEARAEAVRIFLSGLEEIEGLDLQSRGRGETQPVDTNESDEGRQMNRRVEILVKQ